MKKTIITSMLGFIVSVGLVSSSNGQGSVAFANNNFGATSLNAPVTFATAGLSGATVVTPGETVGKEFSADLLFSFDGGATYTLLTQAAAGAGSQYPTLFAFGAGGDGDAGNFAGYFFGPSVTIPGYASGPVTFKVEAYSGATYATSTGANIWRGQSAAFTMASIATGTAPPSDFVGLNPFTVSLTPVPEPTTLALAGLGGLALLAFRRKQA